MGAKIQFKTVNDCFDFSLLLILHPDWCLQILSQKLFLQWNDEFFILPRSTVSSMTAISDSYRFVRTLFAKTGSVRPTEADPQLALSVVPLLVGWESDKISWESSIGTCESDSVDAGSSLTGILGEISETKWRQFSIANRSALLLNLILNRRQSFCK